MTAAVGTSRAGAPNAGAPISGAPGSSVVGLLGRFFAWWVRELSAVAAALSRGARRPALVATVDGERVSLAFRRGRRLHPLGPLPGLRRGKRRTMARQAARGRIDVVLAAPHDRVVTQRFTLPVAAAEDLDSVVAYEIDRVTPFRAAELFYAFRILDRRTEVGKLDVELVFVRRDDLEGALGALAAAGFARVRIDAEAPGGGLAGLDLSGKLGPTGWSAGRILRTGAITLFAALGVVWAGLVYTEKEARLDSLRTAVDQARAAAVAAQQAAISAMPESTAAIEAYERKRTAPMAVEAIAILTEIVPDTTWLEGLSLRGTEIEMSGRSSNATALLGILESHPRFENPEFLASITRDDESGTERFVLGVAFMPRAEP